MCVEQNALEFLNARSKDRLQPRKSCKAIQKRNHQVVDRAEMAADPDQVLHLARLAADAQAHQNGYRKRKLEFSSFGNEARSGQSY